MTPSPFIDHVSQASTTAKPFPDRLHVIAVLNNPLRLASRMRNWHRFEKMINDAGAILYVVELALGDRDFEIVDPHNPRHLGLRTLDELWHKERMIRLAIQALVPNDARYVMWSDADIGFAKANICQEVLQMLQHHYIVQPFSHAIDLGPNDEFLWQTPGFAFEWCTKGALDKQRGHDYKLLSCYEAKLDGRGGWSPISEAYGNDWKIAHPGLAWAADMEALDKIDGGIFDYSVFGSGDWVMCCAWIGQVHHALAIQDPENEFCRRAYQYQADCEEHIHRDIGYVPGVVNHYWHGRKSDRRYALRPNALLVELGFDPRYDIRRDTSGLFRLNTSSDLRSQRIRDTLRYFQSARNEDGNEL